MKKFALLLVYAAICGVVSAQGVAINTDNSAPATSAMLDVQSTNAGILIPRINIPSLSASAPITSPAVSLLVYNTNSGTGLGYHYWNGTFWVKLFTAADVHAPKWSGNNNTTDAIGRTGNVGIGTTTPAAQLHTTGTVRFANYTSGANGAIIRTNTTGDISVTNFSGNTGDVLLGTGTFGAAVTSASAWQLTGNASTNPATNFIGTTDAQDFVIRTTNTERMRVAAGGNVGIGTAPHATYKAQIAGDVLLTSGWLRTTGSTGWFSETYGGGWNMTDATWIRSYGSKSIYQNSGILRTDGTLQVGNAGATLNVANTGNFAYRTNVLFANTTGNVGVGTATPGTKLDVQGGNLTVGTLYGTYVMSGTLASFDTRATNPNPEVYNMGVTSEFKGNAANSLSDGGSYNSVLSVRQWGSGVDMAGGGTHQMGFTQNGNIWHRYSQTLGVWGPWRRLYDSASGGLISCGTANYVVKSDGTNGVCSQIFDNGTNVGIATSSPAEKLTVAGGHGDTKLRLYSSGNGSDQPSNLSLWASEPGVSYVGTGIGYNVNGHPFYGRIDATRGSAYIRFLPTETKFEFQNSSGSTINDVMVVEETGRVGIGTSSPNEILSVTRAIADWQGRFNNSSGSGADVYLANGNGYGMHIRGWNASDGVYTIEMYNNTTMTNAFYNSGRVVLGMVGNVGVGTISPTYKLDVSSTIRAQDVFSAGGQNVIVGDDSYLSDIDVANSMGVYGVQNTDRGGIRFGSAGGTIFGYNGNIGIGTTTPGYRLDLASGTFAFGNGNQRTETRDNAGLRGDAGAQSGFYETSSPTNYPAGASSWWHLIDVRHSNTGNNYAMQFAGSFFDQKLYFRKTSDNAAQPWTEILTGDYFDTNVQTVESTSTLTITGSWTVIPGETITLNNLAAGDRVLVWFAGNMEMDGSDYNTVDVGLFINGTLASVGGYVRTSIDTYYGLMDYINYSATARYNVTSAGNYTFDVRAVRLMGGNNIYIGGDSTDSREGVLTVFVIKN